MKKLLLLFILFAGLKANSQSAAACGNAQNICSNPNFIFQGINGTGLTSTLNVSNPSTNPQTGNGSNPSAPANSGCLQTNGPGPQWLILTVSVAGNLGFIFGDPAGANPQAGFYDWAMWAYTPSTCNGIFNNTLPPVACNWNATSLGGTGMGPVPSAGNANNYQPSLLVSAGQQFLILISNYSGVNTAVSFTSTGTASLTCGFSSAICAGETTTVGPVGFIPIAGSTFTLMPLNVTNNTGVFTVTPLSTTVYTVTAPGSGTTTQTSTTSIVVNPQPSAAPTLTQTTCTSTVNAVNLHVTFNPATPPPTYTVAWSTTPVNVLSTSQQTASNLGALPYQVTVTAAGGCSVVTNFTITPQPAAADFTLAPYGTTFSVTCAQPTLIIDASDPSFSYTWTNGSSAPVMDTEAEFTSGNTGHWTITATNPVSGCMAFHTFTVGQNFTVPTSVVTPSFQNITCLSGVTTVSATSNPTANITHYFYSSQGGTATATSSLAIYSPPIGTGTHCIVNNINGCSSCSTFTVFSNDNFPSLAVTSANQFTIGCSTHSVAGVDLLGETTPTPGGVVNYTLLTPSFTAGNTYTFNTTLHYTLTVPGTYTAVVRDNNNNCQTRVPFSIISNTAQPDVGATVPVSILSCYTPSTQLIGTSSTPNVGWAWTYPGPTNVLTVASPSLIVNTTTNTNNPLVNNYTLTVTDPVNSCINSIVVPIQQDLFPPHAGIGGTSFSITCTTPSVQLSNNSSSGTPTITGFPTNQPIVAILWEGPTPQAPSELTANYFAYTIGNYTMTVRDLNNGCTAQATLGVIDNRNYPNVNQPAPPAFTLDCGSPTILIYPSISGTLTNYTYFWTVQGTVSSTTTRSISVNTPGLYRIQVTNPANGCFSFGTYSVVPGQLNSSFTPDQTTGYAPLTVNFTNNSNSSLGTSSINTVWTFGNGTQSVTPSVSISPTVIYNQPGTYTVTIFANKGVCQASSTNTVFVDIPSKLEIPNVFTPNGDNVNDVFFVNAANLTEINAKIYDRWGRQVYELVSTTGNIAWDGKNEVGKEVSAGTYFYLIRATGKDGQNYDTKGTVTLFR